MAMLAEIKTAIAPRVARGPDIEAWVAIALILSAVLCWRWIQWGGVFHAFRICILPGFRAN